MVLKRVSYLLIFLPVCFNAQICEGFIYHVLENDSMRIYHSDFNIPNNKTLLFTLPEHSGLSIGPSFNYFAPSPTYWIGSGTLQVEYTYYNGSSFINTSHTSGSVNFGSSKNYIYSLGGNYINCYKGNGNAVLCRNYNFQISVLDIVGDDRDGFFLLRMNNPFVLAHFDSTGALTHTYSIMGATGPSSGGGGFAIRDNNIAIHTTAQDYIGKIIGAVIQVTPTTIHEGDILDFGSCPVEMETFPTGIRVFDKGPEISVYPSPAREILSVEINEGDQMSYVIYSMSGWALLQGQVVVKDHRGHLNISELPAGIYHLELKNNDRRYNCRFVKCDKF